MKPRTPVTDWATDFDPLDPRWIEDPYPILDNAAKCPVAHTDRFPASICRRATKTSARLRTTRSISRPGACFSARATAGDPRAAAHLRSARALRGTQDAAASLDAGGGRKNETRTRAICRELIEPLAGKRACDGACDYAQEIPARLTAHMMGLSEDMGDQFRTWIHDFIEVTDPSTIPRVLAELDEFFTGEIAKRGLLPGGNDLISYLIEARINGEPMSDANIKGTMLLILFAGIDTTWSSIGSSLWHLATHDEDRRRLAEEPQLIPAAIEEFLRAYAPVMMGRLIVKTTEIGGCPVREGEMALLPFAAANRDPDVFPDADRVLIDRAENRHAAFGLGIHRCIGSNLARMEMRVAIEEWLLCIPRLCPDARRGRRMVGGWRARTSAASAHADAGRPRLSCGAARDEFRVGV